LERFALGAERHAEDRRATPDVDYHVEDGTGGAVHQLDVVVRRDLEVEPP
jgi:hypothetical protein